MAEKLHNKNYISSVDSISGIMENRIPQELDRKSLKEECLAHHLSDANTATSDSQE